MGWQKVTSNDLNSLGLTKLDSNLYRFSAPFDDANLQNLIYAPTTEGAYYVLLNAQARDILFTNLNTAYKYISVSFLKAFFDNTFDWDSLERFLIEEEESFIRTWWNERLPASLDLQFIENRRKIWLRSGFGKAEKVQFKEPPTGFNGGLEAVDKIKENFAKVLVTLWDAPTTTRATKPPRFVSVSLAKKLKIFIEPDGRHRFPSVDQLFTRIINKINESSSKNGCKLELVGLQPVAPYSKLSSDPFGLYTSYIHEDDWHSYMSDLAESGNSPIRKFIKSASKEMKAVQANYEKRAKEVIDLIASLSGRFLIGEYSGWTEATKKAIQRLDTSTDHFNHISDSVTGRWAEINADKIKNAVGKRDQEDDQKKVMGESAPVVAGSVGWSWKPGVAKNDRQMKNNLYIAEWLHLSAFSWGGYLGSESKNQGATSQMPDNLVLGTSETNSLMTRYEYAWQDLFKAEQILERTGTITGELEILCNLPDKPIRYDTIRKDKYTCDSLNSISADESVQQGPHIQDDTIKTSVMQEIASSYKFVAYTITYTVRLRGTSRILGRDNPSLEICFYPFMRPFFHTVEKQLDYLLFREMKRLAQQ